MSPHRAKALTARFAPITLPAIVEQAALQSRVDSKYIVSWNVFEQLAAQLRETHLVLEIAGDRMFTYDNVYFDTSSLGMYRAHVQRRRMRVKCRTRQYVETDHHAFEIKLKGLRGETVKHALLYERASHGTIDDHARAFIQQRLLEAYGHDLWQELRPTLRTTYRRMTFARRGGAERLTCDFNLALNRIGSDETDGPPAVMADDHVLIEHKSGGGVSDVHLALRALGARPVDSCSKYCLGIALTHADVAGNDFRRLIRAHFDRGPAVAQPSSRGSSW